MQPDLELMALLADEVAGVIKSAIAPVLERMSVLQLGVDGQRDRLVALETKAALPLDLSPVRDRVAALEARAVGPRGDVLTEMIGDLTRRVGEVEGRLDRETDPLRADLGALRERVAVVEVREQIPGPPGEPGTDGTNGRDGVDGLGFDDLAVTFDGDRTIELAFTRGDQRKAFPIVLPFLRYQGVFVEGKHYGPGDVVTWAGSTWHWKRATATKPGDGVKAWTLVVKRGRDGKDGPPGPPGPEGKAGKDWQHQTLEGWPR